MLKQKQKSLWCDPTNASGSPFSYMCARINGIWKCFFLSFQFRSTRETINDLSTEWNLIMRWWNFNFLCSLFSQSFFHPLCITCLVHIWIFFERWGTTVIVWVKKIWTSVMRSSLKCNYWFFIIIYMGGRCSFNNC